MYDFINANSSIFRQLNFGNGDDILIDYLCPIRELKARVWSHKNCLMYVVQGNKGYDFSDQFHKSGKHELIFIRKGGVILHQYFKQPYHALIFMFDDATIREFLPYYQQLIGERQKETPNPMDQPALVLLPSNAFVESVFITSLSYLKDPAPESNIALELKFKELCVNILRDKKANSFANYLHWICNNPDAAFVKLMRQNCQYNFTTAELARIACMSLSTFKREFVRIMGINPGKWLQDQRIVKAIKLISETNKPISEIAFDLGYNDTAAFSKAFKTATEKTPSNFRKSRSA